MFPGSSRMLQRKPPDLPRNFELFQSGSNLRLETLLGREGHYSTCRPQGIPWTSRSVAPVGRPAFVHCRKIKKRSSAELVPWLASHRPAAKRRFQNAAYLQKDRLPAQLSGEQTAAPSD
jgi:hypothetical protein